VAGAQEVLLDADVGGVISDISIVGRWAAGADIDRNGAVEDRCPYAPHGVLVGVHGEEDADGDEADGSHGDEVLCAGGEEPVRRVRGIGREGSWGAASTGLDRLRLPVMEMWDVGADGKLDLDEGWCGFLVVLGEALANFAVSDL
jgi:hypothetical protein